MSHKGDLELRRTRAFKILDKEGADYPIVNLATRLMTYPHAAQELKNEWIKMQEKIKEVYP